ncbi:formin-like protein CG32138 [Cyclospora cayetanensis]|uniref:Formin-like protein CG32138 n=1 Tax=Cyclospora cayetanensis TaxID=88456 RepID=A0A6P6S0A1_9EIME|nr:formin-like protein CG32138 [Cyclospora cayetanensis]
MQCANCYAHNLAPHYASLIRCSRCYAISATDCQALHSETECGKPKKSQQTARESATDCQALHSETERDRAEKSQQTARESATDCQALHSETERDKPEKSHQTATETKNAEDKPTMAPETPSLPPQEAQSQGQSELQQGGSTDAAGEVTLATKGAIGNTVMAKAKLSKSPPPSRKSTSSVVAAQAPAPPVVAALAPPPSSKCSPPPQVQPQEESILLPEAATPDFAASAASTPRNTMRRRQLQAHMLLPPKAWSPLKLLAVAKRQSELEAPELSAHRELDGLEGQEEVMHHCNQEKYGAGTRKRRPVKEVAVPLVARPSPRRRGRTGSEMPLEPPDGIPRVAAADIPGVDTVAPGASAAENAGEPYTFRMATERPPAGPAAIAAGASKPLMEFSSDED